MMTLYTWCPRPRRYHGRQNLLLRLDLCLRRQLESAQLLQEVRVIPEVSQHRVLSQAGVSTEVRVRQRPQLLRGRARLGLLKINVCGFVEI